VMARHLHPVEQAGKPRRLKGRREIDLWLEERSRVLAALVEAEGLGQSRCADEPPDQLALEIEEAA
jgi:hypothetical protein